MGIENRPLPPAEAMKDAPEKLTDADLEEQTDFDELGAKVDGPIGGDLGELDAMMEQRKALREETAKADASRQEEAVADLNKLYAETKPVGAIGGDLGELDAMLESKDAEEVTPDMIVPDVDDADLKKAA
ncbi:MAG: hypothetical protein RLZZ324_1077 [Candidatus Parcubacteria bacterium]|jgi:hypothetical protein